MGRSGATCFYLYTFSAAGLSVQVPRWRGLLVHGQAVRLADDTAEAGGRVRWCAYCCGPADGRRVLSGHTALQGHAGPGQGGSDTQQVRASAHMIARGGNRVTDL